MTEAVFTQQLLQKMKAVDGDRMYLKLCDRFTKGIPDIQIIGAFPQHPLYIEVKVLRGNNQVAEHPEDWMDNLPQAVMTARLGGYYYVHHEYFKTTTICWAKTALAYKMQKANFRSYGPEFQNFDKPYQPGIDLVKEYFNEPNTYLDLRRLQRR